MGNSWIEKERRSNSFCFSVMKWREDQCISQSTSVETPSSLDMWRFGQLFPTKKKR